MICPCFYIGQRTVLQTVREAKACGVWIIRQHVRMLREVELRGDISPASGIRAAGNDLPRPLAQLAVGVIRLPIRGEPVLAAFEGEGRKLDAPRREQNGHAVARRLDAKLSQAVWFRDVGMVPHIEAEQMQSDGRDNFGLSLCMMVD
ncbi:hypothetical protein ASG85_13330 [Paenibacillus sp. Soil724D2]|nr:hypothetical protein ASG85_13330 [Paenibacillus sp. Soil724D2]